MNVFKIIICILLLKIIYLKKLSDKIKKIKKINKINRINMMDKINKLNKINKINKINEMNVMNKLHEITEINKLIIKKNQKLEKKIYLIASKIYYWDKYKMKTIFQDYKIKKFSNMFITCITNDNNEDGNENGDGNWIMNGTKIGNRNINGNRKPNNIKIELPPVKESIHGSKIYIKNISNKNILIITNCSCKHSNPTTIDENIIVRPYSLIKIIALNKKIYLINKI